MVNKASCVRMLADVAWYGHLLSWMKKLLMLSTHRPLLSTPRVVMVTSPTPPSYHVPIHSLGILQPAAHQH